MVILGSVDWPKCSCGASACNYQYPYCPYLWGVVDYVEPEPEPEDVPVEAIYRPYLHRGRHRRRLRDVRRDVVRYMPRRLQRGRSG